MNVTRRFVAQDQLASIVCAAFGPARRLNTVARLRGGSKKGVTASSSTTSPPQSSTSGTLRRTTGQHRETAQARTGLIRSRMPPASISSRPATHASTLSASAHRRCTFSIGAEVTSLPISLWLRTCEGARWRPDSSTIRRTRNGP